MSLITIFLLALALAMDSFAVSVSSGVTMTRLHVRHAVRMAAFFGVFQAAMPVAGWGLGRLAAALIEAVDHWVAFGLLSVIGIKMIYESVFIEEDDSSGRKPMTLPVLFLLAIATSVDAAAVGISLSVLQVAIIRPVVIIGVVTFIVSLAGVWIGQTFGDFFEGKIEITGGLVLIGIGLKILIQHLFFP